MSRLPRTVLALGLVSLLADLASEMVYPLLPRYLTEVLGASVVALGLIEGLAEATASLVKLFAGTVSDRLARRKPLVVAGYALAGGTRPLIGLATVWPVVLALRFVDRVGKGLRGAPRDALIVDATPAEQRGAAFGLHRAMDHAGAVLGPLVAAGLLLLPGMTLSRLFLYTLVPAAAVVVVLLLAVHEPPRAIPIAPPRQPLRLTLAALPPPLRRLLLALLVFTLGNSTDAFILLRLGQAGVSASGLALLWSAHHVVKMAGAFLGGRAADRRGRRPWIFAGWGLFAVVYAGFAWLDGVTWLIVCFLVYGLCFGLTEPAEKAWVADLAPSAARGTAFGTYHAAMGLAALPASLLFGALWASCGASVAFLTGAALSLVAMGILATVKAVAAVPEGGR